MTRDAPDTPHQPVPDPSGRLRELWNNGSPDVTPDDLALVGPELSADVDRVINGDTFLAFRYILPGQLLAKLADPARHTLALQANSGLPGSFDARSFTTRHICVFDRDNHNVLGGSDDPLVGNIGRRPQMDDAWLRVGRRATQGGAELVRILAHAQQHPEAVEPLLRITLHAVAERLARTRLIYPRPNRIALPSCLMLIAQFLAVRTGGRRLQAVSAALFDTIGGRFGLFDRVEVGHVNKADAVRGDVADLACLDGEGSVVLSVEVKDRHLSVREVEDTLRRARDAGVAEILYVLRGGVPEGQQAALAELQARQFTAGHNVYHLDFDDFLKPTLILLGEAGRLAFLDAVGRRVDEAGDLPDRQTWQRLLELM